MTSIQPIRTPLAPVIAILLCLFQPTQTDAVNYVVSRIDRTTLLFDWGARIRMIGIVLPEGDSPGLTFLQRSVVGTEIDFEGERLGSSLIDPGVHWWYVLYLPGSGIYDLGALMIDSGWAMADLRGTFTRQNEYIYREKTARENGLGIWSQRFCVNLTHADSIFFTLPDSLVAFDATVSHSRVSDTTVVVFDVIHGVYHRVDCSEPWRGPTRTDRLGALRRRPDVRACPTCMK